jgi:hypothetical protein
MNGKLEECGRNQVEFMYDIILEGLRKIIESVSIVVLPAQTRKGTIQ